MINGNIKNRIDCIWDGAGSILIPLEIVEQITHPRFIRYLDDLRVLEKNKANRLKQPMAWRAYPVSKADLVDRMAALHGQPFNLLTLEIFGA